MKGKFSLVDSGTNKSLTNAVSFKNKAGLNKARGHRYQSLVDLVDAANTVDDLKAVLADYFKSKQ